MLAAEFLYGADPIPLHPWELPVASLKVFLRRQSEQLNIIKPCDRGGIVRHGRKTFVELEQLRAGNVPVERFEQ